jgi:hypothetical protein
MHGDQAERDRKVSDSRFHSSEDLIMQIDQLKNQILAQFPQGFNYRPDERGQQGFAIDLNTPRSERILRHYAEQPQLGLLVVDHAIADLRGLNRK